MTTTASGAPPGSGCRAPGPCGATVHASHGALHPPRRPPARHRVPPDREPRGERGATSPGDLCPPEPAARRSRRTGPAQGLAGRRRDVHGGVARAALWRHGDDGPRMGDRCGEAPSTAEDLRCPVAGEALLRPGQASRRGGQTRDRRQAGRAGNALVGQAGPGAGDRGPQPVRRAGDRLLRPSLSPFRRSAPELHGRAPGGPVHRREELPHRTGPPSPGRPHPVRPAHGGCPRRRLQERRQRGRRRHPIDRASPAPGRRSTPQSSHCRRPCRHGLPGRG